MIQANEIRIGNYVNDEQTTHVVVGLDNYYIKSYWLKDKEEETLYKTKIHLIKPIPLTEEWLLKFVKIEWISKDVNGIFYWFNGEKKYLKFVHSLQNTYFCIEQKELLCVNT